MSSFSDGQLQQWGGKLEAADWTAADITLMGQMELEDLRKLRDQIRRHNIIAAIEQGQTELWLHPDQRTGWTTGRVIHKHLTDHDLLADCIGDEELDAIEAKGLDFYRKHFGWKAIFAWRSVRDDGVSCLIVNEGRLYRGRDWLDNDWFSFSPALRFRKK